MTDAERERNERVESMIGLAIMLAGQRKELLRRAGYQVADAAQEALLKLLEYDGKYDENRGTGGIPWGAFATMVLKSHIRRLCRPRYKHLLWRRQLRFAETIGERPQHTDETPTLTAAMEKLELWDQWLLRKHYVERWSFARIGAWIGRSKGRAEQLHQRAVLRLAEHFATVDDGEASYAA